EVLGGPGRLAGRARADQDDHARRRQVERHGATLGGRNSGYRWSSTNRTAWSPKGLGFMKVRRLLSGLAAAACASAMLTAPANAKAPPAGIASGSISNEQLVRVLDLLEQVSRGRVAVSSAGTTNEGRPIEYATVGHGPVRILHITQQHGDEPL